MILFRPVRVGLALAAALLTACSSAPTVPTAKPPPPPVANPGARLVNVSEANADANVTLELAQELLVTLPGSITAPQQWAIVDLKPGVLLPTSTTTEQVRRKNDPDDIGVLTRWHFKPQAPGAVALRFELRRPRGLEPAVQSVVYHIVVK